MNTRRLRQGMSLLLAFLVSAALCIVAPTAATGSGTTGGLNVSIEVPDGMSARDINVRLREASTDQLSRSTEFVSGTLEELGNPINFTGLIHGKFYFVEISGEGILTTYSLNTHDPNLARGIEGYVGISGHLAFAKEDLLPTRIALQIETDIPDSTQWDYSAYLMKMVDGAPQQVERFSQADEGLRAILDDVAAGDGYFIKLVHSGYAVYSGGVSRPEQAQTFSIARGETVHQTLAISQNAGGELRVNLNTPSGIDPEDLEVALGYYDSTNYRFVAFPTGENGVQYQVDEFGVTATKVPSQQAVAIQVSGEDIVTQYWSQHNQSTRYDPRMASHLYLRQYDTQSVTVNVQERVGGEIRLIIDSPEDFDRDLIDVQLLDDTGYYDHELSDMPFWEGTDLVFTGVRGSALYSLKLHGIGLVDSYFGGTTEFDDAELFPVAEGQTQYLRFTPVFKEYGTIRVTVPDADELPVSLYSLDRFLFRRTASGIQEEWNYTTSIEGNTIVFKGVPVGTDYIVGIAHENYLAAYSGGVDNATEAVAFSVSNRAIVQQELTLTPSAMGQVRVETELPDGVDPWEADVRLGRLDAQGNVLELPHLYRYHAYNSFEFETVPVGDNYVAWITGPEIKKSFAPSARTASGAETFSVAEGEATTIDLTAIERDRGAVSITLDGVSPDNIHQFYIKIISPEGEIVASSVDKVEVNTVTLADVYEGEGYIFSVEHWMLPQVFSGGVLDSRNAQTFNVVANQTTRLSIDPHAHATPDAHITIASNYPQDLVNLDLETYQVDDGYFNSLWGIYAARRGNTFDVYGLEAGERYSFSVSGPRVYETYLGDVEDEDDARSIEYTSGTPIRATITPKHLAAGRVELTVDIPSGIPTDYLHYELLQFNGNSHIANGVGGDDIESSGKTIIMDGVPVGTGYTVYVGGRVIEGTYYGGTTVEALAKRFSVTDGGTAKVTVKIKSYDYGSATVTLDAAPEGNIYWNLYTVGSQGFTWADDAYTRDGESSVTFDYLRADVQYVVCAYAYDLDAWYTCTGNTIEAEDAVPFPVTKNKTTRVQITPMRYTDNELTVTLDGVGDLTSEDFDFELLRRGKNGELTWVSGYNGRPLYDDEAGYVFTDFPDGDYVVTATSSTSDAFDRTFLGSVTDAAQAQTVSVRGDQHVRTSITMNAHPSGSAEIVLPEGIDIEQTWQISVFAEENDELQYFSNYSLDSSSGRWQINGLRAGKRYSVSVLPYGYYETYLGGVTTRLEADSFMVMAGEVTPITINPIDWSVPQIEAYLSNPKTLSGDARVGSTVTAPNLRLDPADASVRYVWYVSGQLVKGESSRSLKLLDNWANQKLSLEMLVSKPGFISTTLSLDWSDEPYIEPLLKNTVVPSVSGEAAIGKTLTATLGAWSISTLNYSYQWLADGKTLSGETKPTLAVTKDHAGKKLSARVTAEYAMQKVSATSAQTKTVPSPAVKPTPDVKPSTFKLTSKPTIKGSAKLGSSLTANAAVLSPAATTVTYQWKANGKNIKGATKKSYTLQKSDVGKTITVTTTGAKSGYTSYSSTSSATKKVAKTSATATGKLSTTSIKKSGKAKVTVTVKTVGYSAPTGTVTVKVGSKKITASLKAKNKGKITVNLSGKSLKKGKKQKVTLTFSPDKAAKPYVSASSSTSVGKLTVK